MDAKLKHELDDLLYLALESDASTVQIERLNKLLASDPEIRQYAGDYYFITASLRKTNAIPSASFDTADEFNEQYNLLMELAHEEKTAPVLEIPHEPEQNEPVRNVPKRHVDRTVSKINRASLAVAITSLAALLILIAYVRTVPPRETVAVLTDAINPQWQNTSENIEPGHLFYNTDGPILVKSGVIELEFDYGAHVVIEGPCEFMCKADNLIYLDYGRLYARVPEKATGFTVDTKNARIVDLGTEFGIKENIDSTTELHVLKGRTTLLAGQERQKTAFDVVQGQAREIRDNGLSVENISLKENAFVQQIYSATGLIRKGQKVIDLADILGGGNGFGTGKYDTGINPETGEITQPTELNRQAGNTYHIVSQSPFIDGVFVPNGQIAQTVSSLGHTFKECPETCGIYYAEISVAPRIIDKTQVELGGINYSRPNTSSIFIHANLGITYDLKAIRAQLSDIRIARFKSSIGIADSSWRQCNADFWVLVDGQLRYRKENVHRKGVIDTIDIELSDDNRFLTLVSTDGGDPKRRASNNTYQEAIDSDWCIFAEPVLALE